MLGLLWLIPVLPFAGYAVLALFGRRMGRLASALVGVGSVALSFGITAGVAAAFLSTPSAERFFRQELWTWMRVGSFQPSIAFHLDALSMVMTAVVTFVGLLIHLYSVRYMREEEGFSRFFAYLNLFVGSMLTLLLADNLLLLYLGWEGVGLCSYLLIGFWYTEPANGRAAQKAFIVTRVGDAAMAVGLFLLFLELDTLRIDQAMARATQVWEVGSPSAILAAALLLGGAVGKSAQLPLQTWLPDAMAGPTPVSALIHAATMVTAGVYLIARTYVLFELAPPVMTAVAVVGAATLLLAGFSALAQKDLKRILAYSTMSQVGYMFLALGVGAWSAAIFHFFTHAFFKALLFLAAGVVILRLHHEGDVTRMGGLRKQLPLTFWTFLIGAAALSGFPLLTAGFYSKDLILFQAFAGPRGSGWLLLAGLVGSLLTGLYAFRMVFLVFFGAPKQQATGGPDWLMGAPLAILAVLSLTTGFLELPAAWVHDPAFSGFLKGALPPLTHRPGTEAQELPLMLTSSLVALLGIGLAALLYLRLPRAVQRLSEVPLAAVVSRLWRAGWGFDWLYTKLLVAPYVWFARVDRDDVFDWLAHGTAALASLLNRWTVRPVTGILRHYALGLALGAAGLVALGVLL